MHRKALITVILAVTLVSGLLIPDRMVGAASTAVEAPSDTLVKASFGQPDLLDPALDYETAGFEVIAQVYEGLLTLNREKQDAYIPLLSTGWTVSSDGLTYTFNIRKDVRFHNGAELTPEDVAFSFWRGLLQGGSISPQWLLFEPLLGSTPNNNVADLVDSSGALIDDRDALKAAGADKLLGACQQVKQAVTYDDAAWTVTFHLAQSWGLLLPTLAGSWGSVLDKDWAMANGAWNGDCATWQNYYATASADDPLRAITNGTGPYMLDHWTTDEIGLVRNPSYWRTTPMWPGGPSGVAAIREVLIKNVGTDADRATMLVNGEADLATVLSTSYSLLDAQVLTVHGTDGEEKSLVSTVGTLNRYEDIPSVSATDAFFNYAIYTGGTRDYTNGGAWGTGIPADFFTDLHVRKAFSYAFDWDVYIADVYAGQAVQHRGPIIQGIPGYLDSQPVYTYDLAKADTELQQAWGGEAYKGFTLKLSYSPNSGSSYRDRRFAEILKAGIEALNPPDPSPKKFQVEILALDWQTYQSDVFSRSLPIRVTGWQQDLPHPYNWVYGYLKNGPYVVWQQMPTDLRNVFASKIAECLPLIDAQACYEQIQNMAYEQAVDIFLTQPLQRFYTRAEVRGFYINPTLGAPYYYALSKGPQPFVNQVQPDTEATITSTGPGGTSQMLTIPAGSFTDKTSLVVHVSAATSGQPAGFRLGDQAFDIAAYKQDGTLLHPTFDAANPVLIRLKYNPTSLMGMGIAETTLKLFYWNGTAWEDAACGETQFDTASDLLTVPVCHFSLYALGGYGYTAYLPISIR